VPDRAVSKPLPNRPDRPFRPDQLDRPARPDRSDGPGRPGRPDGLDGPDGPGQSGEPGPLPWETAPGPTPFGAPPGRRDLLAATRDALRARHGVLLHGPAGIGKSTLLAALGAAALDGGAAVLCCSPAPEDARLPHLGLIDRFTRMPPEVVEGLLPEPRAALLTALLHGPVPDGRHDSLAVRVAVLEALRRLSRTAPVVLVVDGLQWLDAPSAGVLAFVARRIDDADIRFVAAEQVADGERLGHAHCCPPDTAETAVPPLADEDVAGLLHAEGTALPPPVLRAVLRTAAGNPFYALELGRLAPRDGLPAESGGFLPVPDALRAPLLERARDLSVAAREALLVAAVADRPALPLLRAAQVPDTAATLGDAERAGLVRFGSSEDVRFAHPMLRAALYADATAAERRRAHGRLAVAETEPVARARHLALARPHEDESTAAALMAAAHGARERGEPDVATELAELAVRRTPVDRPADRDRRLLDAAGFACDAGRWEESQRAARAVPTGSGSARTRVRARPALLGTAGQALWDNARLIEDGLREAAGVPELEAALYHWAALRGLLCGELTEAAGHARRSAGCAARAGNPGMRIAALSTPARVRALAGESDGAQEALAEASAMADSGPQSWGLTRMRAVLDLDADRVDRAARHLTDLLDTAGEAAGVEGTVASLDALTRVQVRTGECREALRTAARCTRVAAAAGLESAPALYAAALAETFGGAGDTARDLAARAVRICEADGDRLFLLRALAAHGQAALFTGDRRHVAEAVESLRRVAELGASMGAADPPSLGWAADLAEALVAGGETGAAEEVLREARGRAARRVPGSLRAALERAEGLREAAVGRAKEGAALLRASAERLRPLGLPVDLARTLTALGSVERRARHRTAARTVLAEALRTAERAGAVPLADRAGAELARVVRLVGNRAPAERDQPGRSRQGPAGGPGSADRRRLTPCPRSIPPRHAAAPGR